MTITLKPTASGSTIEQDGSTVLSIESDRSVDIDSGTLHVDATNNRVGIGTASPSKALHVETATNGGMLLTDTTNSITGMYYSSASNSLAFGSTTNHPVKFLTNNTERMHIRNDGMVLLGTTSVGGTGGLTFSPNADDGAPKIIFNRASTTANSNVVQFRNGGSEVGKIFYNSASTAYVTSSDYRLKENNVNITDGITRVKQLNPYRFNFISDSDTTVDGFYAHEVQSIVPEAITGTKDAMKTEEYEVTPAVLDDEDNVVTEAVMGTREVPDYQGIDQSKLVPLLTAALQEAIQRIEALENA